MNIEDFTKYLPYLISLCLVFLTYKYWKESARTAKVQLLTFMQSISDRKAEDIIKTLNEFGTYVYKQEKNGIDLSFANYQSMILYLTNFREFYYKMVEEIDDLYNYKGSFKSALIHKDKKYEKYMSNIYMPLRKEFDKLAIKKGFDKTEFYYDVIEKIDYIINSMKELSKDND